MAKSRHGSSGPTRTRSAATSTQAAAQTSTKYAAAAGGSHSRPAAAFVPSSPLTVVLWQRPVGVARERGLVRGAQRVPVRVLVAFRHRLAAHVAGRLRTPELVVPGHGSPELVVPGDVAPILGVP